MEILVRIAVEKYIPKATTQVSDAVLMLITEHVKKYFPGGAMTKFRWEKLYNNECQDVFFINKENIEGLLRLLYK